MPASSRSSTPGSPGGSPEPLTPRSKIQRLLATVESSDDEQDNGTSNSSKRTSPTDRARLAAGLPGQVRQSVEESSDESDTEIRPRGKLASRMLANSSSTPTESAVRSQNAPERVKEPPRREESNARAAVSEVEDDADVGMADAEDDDDDLPTAPRRIKSRVRPTSAADVDVGDARPPSPGLFVSSPMRPSPTKSVNHNSDSDSDADLPTLKSDRFKALVERKRQERLAREAAEEAAREERLARQEKLASELEAMDSDHDNVSDISDDEGGLRLTQGARPTRKASRKAIEEMNRETQRMARSMQLAHEAKTRKKFTTSDLFKRFNYKPTMGPEPKTDSSSRPASPTSDLPMGGAETPPSSPPSARKPEGDKTALERLAEPETRDGPAMVTPSTLDKSKGKAFAPAEIDAAKPKRRVRVKLPAVSANMTMVDSDDELQVTRTTKDKLNALFDSVPATREKESHSLYTIRALAQIKSPAKNDSRRNKQCDGITSAELGMSLKQKIRQQAKKEKDKRLNMLKAQGIVPQTAEERERQMQEVEDLVAKARDEAQKIMQEERAAAKKNGDNGESDPLAWDDSEDEEFQDAGEHADAEASALELSGSEDEEADNEDNEVDDGDVEEADSDNPLFEDEAEDAESDASEVIAPSPPAGVDEDADEQELPKAHSRRPRKNKTAVLSDDEAEVESTPRPRSLVQVSPNHPSTESPVAPNSVLRSAKKTFIPGLPVDGPAGLSLTQIFAGTMDDSQAGTGPMPIQSMVPFDSFPDSNFSATISQPAEDVSMVEGQTETQFQTQGVQLDLSQSQMRGLDSLLKEDGESTQVSDMVELSQDIGFREYTPLRERFVEPPVSTVDTVILNQAEADGQDSPLVRKGRLRRKVVEPELSAIEEQDVIPQSQDQSDVGETVFDTMKEGAKNERTKQHVDDFNKKKSKAKEMVHEQAEESDDEYAGLGGADGEDSDDESLASVGEMIDDDARHNADERKLAAFYADNERARDEKEVEKLFKDVTTGMLRRKRGADYDLSDSDDGGEARRRMKRRQFAKMQKALFSDERVKKMAEDPGNQAFLRTIEDHGSDEELDYLDIVEEPQPSNEESQSQTQEDETTAGNSATARPTTIPDSQPRQALGPGASNRPPARERRIKDGKKPSNIGEVRQAISSLLEDREGSVIPATEAGSDGEEEHDDSTPHSDKENTMPNPRRGRTAVVDRLSLKRNGSSTSVSTTSRQAFVTSATATAGTFKVPALLRRATTNSLMSVSSEGSSVTTNGSSTSMTGSGFGDVGRIKKTGSKRSGVNAFARENERHAKIQESERRRQEKRVKGARKRMTVVGGLLGKGSFE